jgi:hypothetical protein
MLYELTGFLAIVFVGLILYASVTLDIQKSYSRYRNQQLREVRVVTA